MFSVENAKEAIRRRDVVREFMKTEGFRQVIEEWYYKDEAARIAAGITNPEMQDEIDQRMLTEMFKAIGYLQQWILTIEQNGDGAEQALKQHEEEELEKQKMENAETEIDPITGDVFIKDEK